MSPEDLYLFDLRGYLVVKAALSPEEVAELNELIDSRPSWRDASGSMYAHTGFDAVSVGEGNTNPNHGPIDYDSGILLDWGEPVRRLVGHPSVLPHLEALLGSDFRLDHAYAIFQAKGHVASGHELHGGGTPYDPTQFYLFRDGHPVNGLVAFSFALTDVPAGAGGFCCIPGSHKSNVPFPDRYRDLAAPVEAIVQLPLEAGDVIIFTEALSHGALAWSVERERRVLMYKYCPGYLQWERGSPFVDPAAHEWTEVQRQILRGPYEGGRTGFRGESPRL